MYRERASWRAVRVVAPALIETNPAQEIPPELRDYVLARTPSAGLTVSPRLLDNPPSPLEACAWPDHSPESVSST